MIVTSASPTGPMCFWCLMFNLVGLCELLFLLHFFLINIIIISFFILILILFILIILLTLVMPPPHDCLVFFSYFILKPYLLIQSK